MANCRAEFWRAEGWCLFRLRSSLTRVSHAWLSLCRGLRNCGYVGMPRGRMQKPQRIDG